MLVTGLMETCCGKVLFGSCANGINFWQSHIRVLESAPENVNTLLMGLEYLINISYVDDTEVFKVCVWLCYNFSKHSALSFLIIYHCFGMTTQVCLDYWNSLVLELFEAHHNSENAAATAMIGLQVL